jgi:peroxiredoxin
LSQLWQKATELEQLNVKVIVIAFEPLRSVAVPVAEAEIRFPYYVDEERQLYRYFGILKAGFWDLWGPRTWLIYLRLLLKGRKTIKSQGDIHQRGGDVLIDPQGIVRYHRIGSGPGDRPDPALICKLVANS